MALTERSSLSPANDHWLLISPPTTHLPGVQTTTAAGPALHLRAPSEFLARGRQGEGRAEADQHVLGDRGREEQGRVDVAEAVVGGVALGQGRLVDDRHDGARDQVPVLAQLERDHRLEVEDVLGPLARAEVEVGVVLERHADQVGDRVLRLLGQLLGVVAGRLGRLLAGCDPAPQRQSCQCRGGVRSNAVDHGPFSGLRWTMPNLVSDRVHRRPNCRRLPRTRSG